MSAPLYLITISLPLVTILLVFGMRYFAVVQQARARLAADEAYRALAEKAAAAEAQTASTLAAMEAALSDVRTRLAGVVKFLKEVE
jgi:hypothetical protein